MSDKKKWTLLIYNNGNNDLAPEIYKSMVLAESVLQEEEVAVLMQICIPNDMFIKMIRPNKNLDVDENYVNGRYLIQNKSSILVEEIFGINMSHPNSLFEFIMWGVVYCPADKYAIVLGGHGYKNIGCMTDLCGSMPFIMGYQQIGKCIYLACKHLKIKFEFLFLDTCNANDTYTISMFEYNTVLIKYLITYTANAPFEGYHTDMLIKTIIKYLNPIQILENLCIQSLDLMCFYKVKENIEYKHENIKMIPTMLTPQEVFACISISNNLATQKNKKIIFDRFIKYMKWNIKNT